MVQWLKIAASMSKLWKLKGTWDHFVPLYILLLFSLFGLQNPKSTFRAQMCRGPLRVNWSDMLTPRLFQVGLLPMVQSVLWMKFFYAMGQPVQSASVRSRIRVSALVTNALQLCATIYQKSTAYHPQTKAIVERFNRTLADMLSMCMTSDHWNWNIVLPFVTFTYNSAVQ